MKTTNLQVCRIPVTDLGNPVSHCQCHLQIYFFIPCSQMARRNTAILRFQTALSQPPPVTCKYFLATLQNKSAARPRWAAPCPGASSQPLTIRASGTQNFLYPVHPQCFKFLNTFLESDVCIPSSIQSLHPDERYKRCREPVSRVRCHSHLQHILT